MYSCKLFGFACVCFFFFTWQESMFYLARTYIINMYNYNYEVYNYNMLILSQLLDDSCTIFTESFKYEFFVQLTKLKTPDSLLTRVIK